MALKSIRPDCKIEVNAPCRLHFGLLNCGRGGANASANPENDNRERQFGGIGAMVSRPNVVVSIASQEHFQIAGDLQERTREFCERWRIQFENETGYRSIQDFQLSINVEAPRDHVGVGTGTQLALSLAAGLSAIHEINLDDFEEIAVSMGRGRRSAIGVHGFQLGGFIYESGKENSFGKVSESKNDMNSFSIGNLESRLVMPGEWHVVLATEGLQSGLTGTAEEAAFGRDSCSSDRRERHLRQLIKESIVPSLHAQDFQTFSNALGEYGEQSGLYFASTQGGAYNGETATQLVAFSRERGFSGTGQTSWGPTIYTITPDRETAAQLAIQIRESFEGVETIVTSFDNQGANISSIPLTVS